MITQFQDLYFKGRLSGSTPKGGYLVPDIEALAKAYNIPYYQISEKDLGNEDLMQEIFKNKNCIIEYLIKGLTTVSPKLEYNRPIEQVMPLLSDEEMTESMSIDI